MLLEQAGRSFAPEAALIVCVLGVSALFAQRAPPNLEAMPFAPRR
jgi:hypothetical protein